MEESVRETLQKQLSLLSERSVASSDDRELAALSEVMAIIARILLNS